MRIQIKSIAVPVAFLVLAASKSALSAPTMEESRVQAAAIQPPLKVVSYADLNLGSAEGRQALEYRLRRAAKEVCNHESFRTTGSLNYYSRTKACYEEALAGARGQIEAMQQVVAVTR